MRLNHILRRLEELLALSKSIAESYNELIKFGLTSVTNQRIQTRMAHLKEVWNQFTVIHSAIIVSALELSENEQVQVLQHVYFTQNMYEATQEGYLEALERFTELLDSDQLSATEPSSLQSAPTPSSSSTFVQHSRLPRINIPKFSGAQSEWLPFKNLFVSLVIENPTLSAIEKLQYLKTHLTGSAFNLVKHTDLIADNFQKTWDSLISFYENTRLLEKSTFQVLFNLKRVTKESAKELEDFYSTIMQIYRTFESLKCPIEHWDAFLIFICSIKLDSETMKLWEQHLGASKVSPTWRQFSDFLFSRLSSLVSLNGSQSGRMSQPVKQPSAKVHHQSKTNDGSKIKTRCSLCKENHFVSYCPQYISKSVQQKLGIISKNRLCYNCLGAHKVSCCRVTKRCQKCGRKHHSSIHQADASTSKEKDTKNNPKDSPKDNTQKHEAKVLHASSEMIYSSSVLLATAQVILIAPSGRSINIRALIDQGSEISIVSEKVVQFLKLSRKNSTLSLTGIGSQKAQRTKGSTLFALKPYFHSEFEIQVNAQILPKLTSSIPCLYLDRERWSHVSDIRLADPNFNKPGSIDLILGADVYCSIIEEGIIRGDPNTPIAQSTKLGWIISGLTNHESHNTFVQGYHVTINDEVHDLLRKFWEIEEFGNFNRTLSEDELACEMHFQNTHSREADGRYVVKLPFRDSPSKLGNSKNKAIRLMTNLFNKFAKNPEYAEKYTNFIDEFVELKHMEPVESERPEPELAYYLPHHGVIREQSLSTKLRVVFNASSKTTSGLSINQLLYSGAKLHLNLFNVLIWFRCFRYVFFADVEKMFRQIRIHPDDLDFHRIVWMDKLGKLIILILLTVTYGFICSPWIALRTFEQLIQDEGFRFPLALPTMKKGRYVDDFFGGEDTVAKTKLVVEQVNSLCMAGGFPLKKWISNHPEVLSSIPVENRIDTSCVLIDDSSTIHALGLAWDPYTDQFKFTLNLEIPKVVSKRSILSTIAKLFDPLGFIAPISISGKILIQELWSSGLDWDDKLPPELQTKWKDFIDKIQEASSFTFPRWIGFTSSDSFELHGFCDASQQAATAVVYLRSCTTDGQVTVTFVASKTKVAPLKRLTIPRLELIGAVLLVKLIESILLTIDKSELPIFAWIDSSVAYTWITNHPSRWKEFVHNRVCYIQDTLPQCRWGLVPGLENPADLATRGITPSQLLDNSTWWIGPEWLSLPSSQWPQASVSPIMHNLEERERKVCNVTVRKPVESWDLLTRYSCLYRLFRITALCQKFISRLRKRDNSPESTLLSCSEIKDARSFWIRKIQHIAFASEIKILLREQVLPKSNSLSILVPYVDSKGLLRVGGRLQNSLLPEESKHPYILPKDSTLTSLIIADSHMRTLHGGTQVTLSYIRQSYWILRGRTAVKHFIFKCLRCTRFRQKRAQQLMGELPAERVVPSRPFLHSGVDYAGPFTIKTWKGRNAKTYKGYIALFVCLATSAIHLELVTDYTSEAFIAAYKRFTSRRGICSTLTSDCGTNFQGAEKELSCLFSSASDEWKELASLLLKDGTQWKFIPPGAPHFGGKWESGVKSVKHHLKRTVSDTPLTYEEFTTWLIQIEAVLNSRPLCTLQDDPSDLLILTPAHFLIGESLSTIPEPSLALVQTSHLNRWQLLQQKLEQFWSLWSKDYLQRQLSVYKWNQPQPSLVEGSIVLVVDERYPPSKWPLGRIIKTHPGKDGLTRVVTVKTQCSELKRSITKLCPLNVDTSQLQLVR